jgi:hypothetical protein
MIERSEIEGDTMEWQVEHIAENAVPQRHESGNALWRGIDYRGSNRVHSSEGR